MSDGFVYKVVEVNRMCEASDWRMFEKCDFWLGAADSMKSN